MYNLSNAFAKGRTNTAGYLKLAVFFLFCLFVSSSCNAAPSDSYNNQFLFVDNGKLCSFCVNPQVYTPLEIQGSFMQKGVSLSKKKGWFLAWNKNTQQLYHIDENCRVNSKSALAGGLVYVDKSFVLAQTNSFDNAKGFGFTLYSIKYSRGGKKLKLKKVWNGFIDCFVSDCFFTADGVCVCGGTKDDSRHNVYYITSSGIHKCFSTAKNSDFLRILNADNKVYAFISGRDKTSAHPDIYNFTLDGYIEGTDSAGYVNLNDNSDFPPDFNCFFGYGFVKDSALVIPASIGEDISFICYDFKTEKMRNIVPETGGCMAFLGNSLQGALYIARDPLTEGSFYGISCFTGTECKKIKEIY